MPQVGIGQLRTGRGCPPGRGAAAAVGHTSGMRGAALPGHRSRPWAVIGALIAALAALLALAAPLCPPAAPGSAGPIASHAAAEAGHSATALAEPGAVGDACPPVAPDCAAERPAVPAVATAGGSAGTPPLTTAGPAAPAAPERLADPLMAAPSAQARGISRT